MRLVSLSSTPHHSQISVLHVKQFDFLPSIASQLMQVSSVSFAVNYLILSDTSDSSSNERTLVSMAGSTDGTEKSCSFCCPVLSVQRGTSTSIKGFMELDKS